MRLRCGLRRATSALAIVHRGSGSTSEETDAEEE